MYIEIFNSVLQSTRYNICNSKGGRHELSSRIVKKSFRSLELNCIATNFDNLVAQVIKVD